jgi:hypothetical protein
MTGPIDITQLPAVVAQMRALGVTRWGDIELGPDPNTRPDEEGETQRTAEAAHAKAVRDQRVRFGASGGPIRRVPT